VSGGGKRGGDRRTGEGDGTGAVARRSGEGDRCVACGGGDHAQSRRPAIKVLEERLRGGAAWAPPHEPRGRGEKAVALSHAREGRWAGGGGVVEIEKDRARVCFLHYI
jgi:hypothetical protein